MALLSPNFRVGRLSEVTSLSLVLRTNRYGFDFVVSGSGDAMMAVVLNPEHGFVSFPAGEAHNHEGVIIEDIAIEVDVDLSAERNLEACPLGALQRKEDGLFLRCQPHQGRSAFGFEVRLMSGLPECRERMNAAFTRWSIVKGTELARQVLYTIDVSNGVPASR